MVLRTTVTLALALAAGCDGSGTGTEPGVVAPQPGAVSPETEIAVSNVDASVKAACPVVRTDLVGTALVSNGNFGSWASCPSFCPAGSFAYGLSHKSEPSQGGGDDTALNGIALNCNNRVTGAFTGSATSATGPWGSFLAVAMCPNTNAPLTFGNLQLEASQGIGDDTSANRISGTCKDGTQINPISNTAWGTWRGWVGCPAGTAVCGIRTRVEGSKGLDDDTALNGVELQCCAF